MAQQTAVEWLESEIKKIRNIIPKVLFEKAKQMEKEQMKKADQNGTDRTQYQRDLEYGGAEYWEEEPKHFEEYYNETYGK